MSNWIVWIQRRLNLRLWKLWTWFLDELYLPETSFTLSRLVLGCQATAQDNYWDFEESCCKHLVQTKCRTPCYRLKKASAMHSVLFFAVLRKRGKATHVDPNFFEPLRENPHFPNERSKNMGISCHKNTVGTGCGEEVCICHKGSTTDSFTAEPRTLKSVCAFLLVCRYIDAWKRVPKHVFFCPSERNARN